MNAEFYSCGKLLITGEYLILRGARGLALPTSRGQHLTVTDSEVKKSLQWRAKDYQGHEWFSAFYALPELTVSQSTDDSKSQKLSQLLKQLTEMNPDFLSAGNGVIVESELDFPRDWGLGSSSTLAHLLAQWAQVDPFELQEAVLGGSGYDVMVAAHQCPIIFSRIEGQPKVDEVRFAPDFKDKLWFVHCGHKQISANEVARFDGLSVSSRDIDHVSRISDALLEVQTLESFERTLVEHDLLLSRILGVPSASDVYSDFNGLVKYLGAWGGDFMLAVGTASDMDFFKKKGMNTIISFDDMIKQ